MTRLHAGLLPLLVGGLAMWQTAVSAQDTGDSGVVRDSTPVAEKRSPQIEEIVVTAQKREQNLQDVPISIGVLTSDELDQRNIIGGRQLAQAIPSLSFTDNFSPSTASLSMRGLGSYVFEGGIQPSVGMVVDGVVLARPGEFITELADIARIEVLRGPQGTLLGKNATAGAINITRRNPTDHFEGSVDVSFTSDDEILTRAMVSGPLSNGVRGRLVGYYRNLEPFIENFSTGGDAGGVESYGLSGKLEFDLADNLNLLLSADVRDATHGNSPQVAVVSDFPARIAALGNGDPVLGQQILDDPYKASFDKRGDRNLSKGYGVSADLSWNVIPGAKLKSISAYRWSRDHNNPDVDSTPANGGNLVMPIINLTNSLAPGGTVRSRFTEWDYFTQEFRFEGTGGAVDWVAGAYYSTFDEVVKNDVSFLIIDVFADPDGAGANLGGTATPNDEYILSSALVDPNGNKVDSLAFFGDATWHLTDRLDVFAGLRWTQEDLSVQLNNYSQFAVLSFDEIASRYDPATDIFNTDDIPVFPSSATSVGNVDDTSTDVGWRLGASFRISEDVAVYGSASRGFVGSGANIGRTAVIGNAILEPTTSTAFELGLKSTLFDRRLRLNLAVFQQNTDDLQTARLVPGTVNTEAVNAGNLKSRGAEVDITWLITHVLSFNAAVTWLDTEFSDLVQPCYFGQTAEQGCTIDSGSNGVPDSQNVSGNPAINTPEFKYTASLNLDVPLTAIPWNFYGLIAYVWQDEVQFNLNYDPLTVQDAYGLLDVTVGLREQNGRYDVSLFGRNVTDQYYDTSMSEAFGALGRVFVRPPRDGQAYYGVRVRVNF